VRRARRPREKREEERNVGWRVARLAAAMRVEGSREREIEGEGGWSNEEREERGWRLGFKQGPTTLCGSQDMMSSESQALTCGS
jgi:hypothetical protein